MLCTCISKLTKTSFTHTFAILNPHRHMPAKLEPRKYMCKANDPLTCTYHFSRQLDYQILLQKRKVLHLHIRIIHISSLIHSFVGSDCHLCENMAYCSMFRIAASHKYGSVHKFVPSVNSV